MDRLSRWHAGPADLGPAVIAGIGCALPLSLGLLSGHPGFIWAAVGAFQAAQVNPLHRAGMLRMLLMTGLGAWCAGIGFWAATDPLITLLSFAAFALLLAWLQRLGNEAGKLGASLALCLCLGQGQYGSVNLNNATAVATLFALGGLWVCLLAFGLRGLHGLRTWPHMPRLLRLFKVLRRHARRLPHRQWRLHALGCVLAFAPAGIVVNMANLPHGYWLTLTVLAALHLESRGSLLRTLQAILVSLGAAVLLIAIGHGLQSPAVLVAALLPLIVLCRAFQFRLYSLFLLQTSFCLVLLTESLATDWQQSQVRLTNALLGAGLALLAALVVKGLRHLLASRTIRSREYRQQR